VTASDVLERAYSLAGEGDWEGAAELLLEHLEDFADDPAMHCWLGVAERELGLGGAAFERFKRALALEPEDPVVLATAGNGIAAFDDPDAERALRVAALTAPDLPLARLLYGAYLSREGFLEQALVELTAARELDPGDAEIMYEVGVAHALAGQLDRAADALADSVRLDPENGWVRVVFGLVLIEEGRTEEAAGELIAGARRRPDDLDAQLAAALATAAAGHEALAYEMLERARLRSADVDVRLVSNIEERLEAGPESAEAALDEDIVPDLLRSRLQERP
jgi:tetratricopeptide (TPR) repeat protein